MSTYYYFGCRKCETQGGFFSRQAWGVGNADLIDSFKFYASHTVECGAKNICVFDENSHEHLNWPIQTDDAQWMHERREVFPHSGDWARHDQRKGKS